MLDKKVPVVEPRPETSGTASSSNNNNAHHENEFSADLEQVLVGFSLPHDLESQTQDVGASKAPQPSDNSGSSSSLEMVVKTPVRPKWRWMGEKDVQNLVTSKKPPPSVSVTELGNEPKSPSSAAVAGEGALEKGIFVRGVTEGIQQSVESEGEGGRPGVHILPQPAPPTASNPPPPPPKERKSFMVAAAAAVAGAAGAGGKKRKVSSVVDDQSTVDLDQDLEKGAVSNVATVGGGGATDATPPEDDEEEHLCRVCHLTTSSVRKADVIDLGCACKLDLGRAHRECAETWFQVRGNRQCEICGETAQNVRLLEPVNNHDNAGNNADTTITVVTVHHRSACWQNRPIRNFLLVFLVAAFLIPWLFRFAYYS